MHHYRCWQRNTASNTKLYTGGCIGDGRWKTPFLSQSDKKEGALQDEGRAVHNPFSENMSEMITLPKSPGLGGSSVAWLNCKI